MLLCVMGYFTSAEIEKERVKTCQNVSVFWFDTYAIIIVFMLKEIHGYC